MALVVTVAINDSVNKILMTKRLLGFHEVHTWFDRVRELNPHISNLDRISAGEKLLIPDTLHEEVSEKIIWENAMRNVPPQLISQPSLDYEIPVHTISMRDSVDELARLAFENSRFWNLASSVKRAILLHNNPRLQKNLGRGPLPVGALANMAPFKLSHYEVRHWENQHTTFQMQFTQLTPAVQEMYTSIGPTSCFLVGNTAQKAKEQGAAVGLDDVVAGAASNSAAAGSMSMNYANDLIQEISLDGIKKFGSDDFCSSTRNDSARVQSYFKSHPKFWQLMRFCKEVPGLFFPEAGLVKAISGKGPYANTGFLNKHLFMPSLESNASKFMGTIKKGLNSRVRVLKVASKGAYVVPIVPGVADVVHAPPEWKMRTLFEEGFGVLDGVYNTYLVPLGGLAVASVICFGPKGLFLSIFICASLMAIGSDQDGAHPGPTSSDIGSKLGGRMYYSIEDLFGAF